MGPHGASDAGISQRNIHIRTLSGSYEHAMETNATRQQNKLEENIQGEHIDFFQKKIYITCVTNSKLLK